MWSHVVLGIASLCLMAICATAQQSTVNPKLLLRDRVWIATQIYSSVTTKFAHWRAVPDLDFDKEFKLYLDQIIATDDRRSFDLATFELIAKLKNAHTRFWDTWLTDKYGAALGFSMRPIDGLWTVTQSSIADLHRGDTIESIDGQTFEDFFGGVRKYIATSNEQEARIALTYCPYLFPASFTLRLSGGRQVLVKRTGQATDQDVQVKVQESLGKLYIQIPSFGDARFEQSVLEAVEKHSTSQSLIIDVRGNGGGSTPRGLMAKLMDKPYHGWRESTPDSIGILRALGAEQGELDWSQTFEPRQDHYKGAIYLLVDAECGSACEDFVAPFKETHRGLIIGEPTWGSTGQPINNDFGNGMSLSVSTKRESFPNGSPFEGVGITPDIEVHVSAKDVGDGRDPVLERAYALIRDQDGQK